MDATYAFVYADGVPVAHATVTISLAGPRRAAELFVGRTDVNGIVKLSVNTTGVAPTAKAKIKLTDVDSGAALYTSDPIPLQQLNKDRQIRVTRAGIDLPGSVKTPKGAVATSLADSLKARFAGERQRSDAVHSAASTDITRRRKNQKAGKALSTRVFGSKPLSGAADKSLFVPRGEDAKAVVEKAQRKGLDRLGKQARAGVQLRGTTSIGEPRDGATVTSADVQRVLSAIPASTGMSSVVRELLQRCESKHRAATVTEASPATTASAGVAASTTSPTLAQRLATLLDRSFSNVALGERPTTTTVASSLAATIPSGPADVAAYYDFRSLQIAWADVWTAAIDGLTERQIRDLYESVVEVLPPSDVDADLSEIEELKDVLSTLEDSVAAVNASLATPTELAGWNPAIAVAWADLSFSDQEYLRFLQRADGVVDTYRAMYNAVRVASGSVATSMLESLNEMSLSAVSGFDAYPAEWIPAKSVGALVGDEGWADDIVSNVLEAAEAASATGASRLGRAERLIEGLKTALAEPYQFDVFAPEAHNFGILVTYRQQWLPLTYQAGDLAGAIALAPNERRTYRIERKSTRTDARTSSSSRSIGGSNETSTLSRAEADITSTAQRNLSAGANTSVTGSLGEFWSVTGGAQVSTDQGTTSNQTKRDISEATRKSAQDYRDEHKVEIRTDESTSYSVEETRELTNPNNELTVTYLFYELQRRYEVAQRLHHVEPVVLVAYDMPTPDEIDEAFVLRYDWIIAKVLLDQSFEAALRHIRTSLAGDEIAVEVQELQWRTQLALVAELRRQGATHQSLRDAARRAVADAVTAVSDAGAGEEYYRGGLGRNLGERIYSAEGVLADGDAENARASLDWASLDLAQIESQVREAATALERATESYVSALRTRLNKRTAIDRFLLHLKENIFHYMQAIWRHEHVDQRYLRLYNREIQWPGASGEAMIRTAPFESGSGMGLPFSWAEPFGVRGKKGRLILPTPKFAETRALHEVADLDRPLGFRGNMGVFRLRENNALTLWMAQDFLDTHFGISDPDPLGELPTAEEALAIAECAWKEPGLTTDQKTEIAAWLMNALEAAHAVSQEIVVPTGELFIEALPGAHPLLEDFKLRHRAYDAQRAGAQAVMAEIEALRLAMRLEAGDVSDPDVDRVVRIEGVPTGVSVDAG